MKATAQMGGLTREDVERLRKTLRGGWVLDGNELDALCDLALQAIDRWVPVSERLPDYEVMVLATDGVHFAGAYRTFEIEKETKLRGNVDGKFTAAFMDKVPNPDAGKRHEYFIPLGCSAFDKDTQTENYEGCIDFTPTHWMPLPPPPPERP